MSYALLAAGLVLMVGAVVQGSVGYGMNLLAAPIFALLDPSLIPVPLLMVTTVHAGLAAIRERSHTDWPGVGWAVLGRAPGIVLGVLVVALLPERPFSAAVGASVLICIAMSLLTWQPRPTPRALVLAGIASGTFGTASTIGGPPVALLYQHERGPTIRATMAVYFAIGSLLSVLGLAAGGEVHGDPLGQAALLLPFLVAGFLLSNPLRKLLDTGWMRPAVLAVATLSAAVLVVRSILG